MTVIGTTDGIFRNSTEWWAFQAFGVHTVHSLLYITMQAALGGLVRINSMLLA